MSSSDLPAEGYKRAMSRSQSTFHRSKFARVLPTLCMILATFLRPTQSFASDGFVFVNDDGGANQVDGGGGAQNDLTRLGIDESHAGDLWLQWSWDSTDTWVGNGQKGNACALFDTDGDGNANVAVCVEIENTGNNANPGAVRTTTSAPLVFLCAADSNPDKCGGSSPVAGGYPSSDMLTAGLNSTTTGAANLISPTDPFVGGSNYPNDTTIVLRLSTADLPAGAQLINVCSYPSLGQGANNNPGDCTFKPLAGFLTIVKQTGETTTQTFSYSVSPAANDGTTTFSINGAGTVVDRKPFTPGSYALNENIPAGWTLNSASCVILPATTTGTVNATLPKAGASTGGLNAIAIEAGKETVCTFSNAVTFVPNPAITLDKVGVLNLGGDGKPNAGDIIDYTFSVTNTGNVALTNVSVTDAQLGLNCSIGALAAGATNTTCTGSHTLTQADVDAGTYNNSATATGTFNATTVSSSRPVCAAHRVAAGAEHQQERHARTRHRRRGHARRSDQLLNHGRELRQSNAFKRERDRPSHSITRLRTGQWLITCASGADGLHRQLCT